MLTLYPFWAKEAAAIDPAGPPPIIRTSDTISLTFTDAPLSKFSLGLERFLVLVDKIGEGSNGDKNLFGLADIVDFNAILIV